MKSRLMKCWLGVLVVTGAVLCPAVAENLGDVLKESGWDKILGTWVDAETEGNSVEVHYAWKYEDQLIEATSRMGSLKSTSLVARNAKTGEIYQVGGNNRGGSSLGKWSDEGGDAILEAGYVSEEGVEGSMRIRHHFKDHDTMVVTIEVETPITVTLVRKK